MNSKKLFLSVTAVAFFYVANAQQMTTTYNISGAAATKKTGVTENPKE